MPVTNENLIEYTNEIVEEKVVEEEVVREYNEVKYYDVNDDGKFDFYDNQGNIVNIVIVDNRIINLIKINDDTKKLYTKILEPVPPGLKKIDKSHANKYSNTSTSDYDETLSNVLKRKTKETIEKLKSSFKNLLPSKKDRNNESLESLIEEKPKKRKRTMKNNYTFHRIPDKRFKNSTIPKKNSKNKDNKKRSVSSNIEKL